MSSVLNFEQKKKAEQRYKNNKVFHDEITKIEEVKIKRANFWNSNNITVNHIRINIFLHQKERK